MNVLNPAPVVVTLLLLAIGGCADVPLMPRAGTADTLPLLAAGTMHDCQTHPVGGSPLLTVITPGQRVEIVFGEGGRSEGRFRSYLEIHADGRACGKARLEFATPASRSASPRPHIMLLVVTYTEATVRRLGTSTFVQFAGEVEQCEGHGGPCETLPISGQVRQASTDDDPVWQLHGPGVCYSFPAQTRFSFTGSGGR